MKNICRAFILYNDFLPPVAEAHQDWQYLSFGNYDGLSVGDNLFEENPCDFSALWEYHIDQGKNMNGSFSSQILWGVRYEASDDGDGDFWDETQNEQYPFLFISLLQIKQLVGEKAFDKEERVKLEKTLTEHSVRKAITYLTLDNSDLILAIRCKNYQDGADAINAFHYEEDLGLNYSFTVASIRKTFLADDEKIKNVKGNVSHAYVQIIEKYPGSISYIHDKIKESIGESHIKIKEAILGCNDEVIVVEDVPWNQFLKLFQDNRGILNHSNELYGDRLTGVTTLIGEKQKVTKSGREEKIAAAGEQETKEEQTHDGKSLSTVMREKCKKMGEGKDIVQMNAVKKSIYQVINSLYKFERTPFRDYMFQTVFLPLNMVIDMAEEVKEGSVENFYNSFYEFMKGLNRYAQNSGRSDRQFTQTPDMNIRIYETPVKLNAFYNAFIYYLKQFLNELEKTRSKDKEHEYEFLACPGVTNNMQVQELFKTISDTKRLFLGEMPENQVYNPKMMMAMLAHEVAHFVGKDIRNRKMRSECAERIAGKMVVKYFRANLKRFLKDNADEYSFIQNSFFWEKTEKNIVDKLKEFCKSQNYKEYLVQKVFRSMSEQEKEQLQEMVELRREYSEMLQRILSEGITDILEEYGEELWKYLWERDYLYWIERDAVRAKEKRAELKLELKTMMWSFERYYRWNPKTLSVESAIDAMLHLFKECIADLIAILTLKLTTSEYFLTILQSMKDQGLKDDFKKTEMIIRSSLVTGCMSYDKPEIGYTWTGEMLEEINSSGEADIVRLKDEVLDFKKHHLDINGQKTYENADEDKAVDLLEDADILEIMLQYLLRSKTIFVECINRDEGGAAAKRQEELCKLYNLFSEENVEELTWKMQNCIVKFLEEIRRRNEQYAGRRENK